MRDPQGRKAMSSFFEFIRRQWFLVALVLAVSVGLLASRPLITYAEAGWLRTVLVMVVMFIMSLPMKLQQFVQAVRKPQAAGLAILMNYLAMPVIAWPLSWIYTAETGDGILVAAVTPCTLASAAVWTRRAGGDDATALLVTVATNAACFAVAPFWLWLMLDQGVATIDGWEMAALAIGLGGAIGELWVQDGLLLMMALGLSGFAGYRLYLKNNSEKRLQDAISADERAIDLACRFGYSVPNAYRSLGGALKELVEQTRKKKRRSYYEDRLEALRKSASKARAEMAQQEGSRSSVTSENVYG